MKKKLIVIGGHGSGEIAMSVFAEVNRITDEWILAGFLTDIVEPGSYLGQYKVLGPSEAILDYVNQGYYIHYALHLNAKNKEERVNRFRAYDVPLEQNATAIHPRAYIDPSTRIGFGCVLCANVCTSFAPQIGNFIHLYTNSFVGHDSQVGDFTTIAAHSVIGARNLIREGAHIGLNSTTKEDVTIGRYAIAGMGSVITKNVDDYAVVAGNPARLLYYINEPRKKNE